MRVKIKTWDAMVKELGVTEYGYIKCKNYFIPEMEKRMPKDRCIEVIPYIDGIYINGKDIPYRKI